MMLHDASEDREDEFDLETARPSEVSSPLCVILGTRTLSYRNMQALPETRVLGQGGSKWSHLGPLEIDQFPRFDRSLHQ